jgi:hypothetical protein
MKSVFIAGSRKFYGDVEKLICLCKEDGIKAETAGKPHGGEDTFESERDALLRAFQRIDSSDILFVVAGGGYVGKAVALEIAYAYAKGKEIISSETISDFSVRALVTKALKPEELARYIKG